MEAKIQSLANYLSDLAEKYQFTEDEAETLQDMLEDIYDGEDEEPTDYEDINEKPAEEPTAE